MSVTERGATRLENLRDERDDLLRSLRDLVTEHVAGDIADEDYERLRRDYIARTSLLLKKIEELERPTEAGATSPGHRHRPRLRRVLGRSKTRRVLVALIAIWVLAAVSLIALHFAGVRLPGQSATGSISLSEALVVQQELTQASVIAGTGDISDAIKLYGQVLAKVPNQHEALTYQGWLIRLSGSSAHDQSVTLSGDAELKRAVSIAPNYPDARGLYGIALFEDLHRTHDSLAQFDALVRDHPAASFVTSIRAQVISIYKSANVTPPALIAKSPAS